MDCHKDAKVKRIISENIFTKSKYLDLSNLNLTEFPDEIYEATHLEYLYLSNNMLKDLPISIFQKFLKLTLLDLRFNKLETISGEIKNLKFLELLLLDGNNLTQLPVEMGLLENIKGINIGSNPIVFPEPDVISLGYKAIIMKLSNIYNSDINGNHFDATKNNDNASDDVDPTGDMRSIDKFYKPKIYKEIRKSYLDKNRKINLSKQKLVLTQSSKHEHMVKLFPEPVSLESIERKVIEQMRLVKMKEVKQQRQAILQNEKDKNALYDWKDEARNIQSYKCREQFNKLPLEIKLESDSRVLDAPFKVDKQHLEIISSDELNALKHKSIPKTPKPQPIDRETLLMIEAEKRNKQKSIHLQIKKQNEYLMNKRHNPKATPHEEVETAKRDLEIVMKLQKELLQNMNVN